VRDPDRNKKEQKKNTSKLKVMGELRHRVEKEHNF
jgi:hypothetical protein